MNCCAKNSLPSLLAVSPLHFSSFPRTPNFIPASFIIFANANVTFIYLLSNAPAQPTQNTTSSPSAEPMLLSFFRLLVLFFSCKLLLKSSIQSFLCSAPKAHGDSLFSRFLNIVFTSGGNDDSIIARSRLISTIGVMCSIITGHSSTQAPHVVQAQSSSCVI